MSQDTDVPPPAEQRLSKASWILLILFTLSLYVVNLGGERTFTGHECYVAEAAREMLASGDWLVPRIAGNPWLEKPPLPHWIVASTASLSGGVNEFTARLPSALAGLLGVLLITQLAVRWFGPTHGMLTGFIQATTVYTTTYARLAESDIYLWLLVVGCLVLFARSQVQPASPARWYNGPAVFFLLLGLTQMVKGPMFGAVLTLLPCLAFTALQWRWPAWKWFLSWRGILLFVVVSVAWPAAILMNHPDAWELWKLHTFDRFGDKCLNPHPWWYYATTIPWQLLPWTLLVLPALPASWRRAKQDSASPDRFLWLWFVLPLLLLSATKAKHHHYLMYSLPPCSMWAAEGILRLRAWAMRFATGRQCRLALAGFLTMCWLGYGYVHSYIMPRTDRYAEETALLRRLNAPQHEGTKLVVYCFDPARILLYCHLPVELLPTLPECQEHYEAASRAYFVTSLGHAAQLEKRITFNCVDRAAQGRWENLGAFTQLGVFRVEWQPPAAPVRPVSHTP